jgi:hypothetical protein
MVNQIVDEVFDQFNWHDIDIIQKPLISMKSNTHGWIKLNFCKFLTIVSFIIVITYLFLQYYSIVSI